MFLEEAHQVPEARPNFSELSDLQGIHIAGS